MRKEYLQSLVMANSPSGFEGPAMRVFAEEMNSLGAKEYYADAIGNLAFSIGEGDTKVLLSGHIDTINSSVSMIFKDGTLAIMNTGGMDIKALLGARVLVLDDTGKEIQGIVGKIPIHLEDDEQETSVGEFKDLRVDIGCTSKEEVESLGIHVGSLVVHEPYLNLEFGKNLVMGTALDDKVGVFITTEILRKLMNEAPETILKKYTIIGLATVQEETGLRGALRAARGINPDISIDFDVTFASDGEQKIDEEVTNVVRLGEGGILSWGADKDRELCSALKSMSQESNVKLQEAVSRCGGTNTARFQLEANCKTALLSIPNRNMHTPVEECHWGDIESIIDLVYYAISEGRL